MSRGRKHICFSILVVSIVGLYCGQIDTAQSSDQKKNERCLCQDCTIASSPTGSHPYTREEATIAAGLASCSLTSISPLFNIVLDYCINKGEWLNMSILEAPYERVGIYRLLRDWVCKDPDDVKVSPSTSISLASYPYHLIRPLISYNVEFQLGDIRNLEQFLASHSPTLLNEGQVIEKKYAIMSVCKQYRVIAQKMFEVNADLRGHKQVYNAYTTTLTRQCYLNQHARILALIKQQILAGNR